jgi:hypothetical protein
MRTANPEHVKIWNMIPKDWRQLLRKEFDDEKALKDLDGTWRRLPCERQHFLCALALCLVIKMRVIIL